MAKIVRCPTCGERYRTQEDLEDLRDNDGMCLQCNEEIEVKDWDRILASFEDEDLDDVEDLDDDEDSWDDEDEEDADPEDDDEVELEEDFEDEEDLADDEDDDEDPERD